MPGPKRKDIQERFWPKVRGSNDPSACWLWTGYITNKGYGQIGHGVPIKSSKAKSPMASTHRVVYELVYGAIPRGLHLDHLCRNRACVNPTHLEPVTPRENILRGVGATARNAKKTHCPRGHELAGENLAADRLKLGQRTCVICRNAYRSKGVFVF